MKPVKELVAEARQHIASVSPQEALTLLDSPEHVFIDLRDSAELLTDGKIPGAVHAHRGGLEFMIDPTTEFHNKVFASGKKFIFYCLGGGRSALATWTAQNMGLTDACDLAGGFRAWKQAGGPVEPVTSVDPIVKA